MADIEFPGLRIDTDLAIEKMAEAIYNEHYGDPDAWSMVYGPHKDKWLKLARVALGAYGQIVADRIEAIQANLREKLKGS